MLNSTVYVNLERSIKLNWKLVRVTQNRWQRAPATTKAGTETLLLHPAFTMPDWHQCCQTSPKTIILGKRFLPQQAPRIVQVQLSLLKNVCNQANQLHLRGDVNQSQVYGLTHKFNNHEHNKKTKMILKLLNESNYQIVRYTIHNHGNCE